MDVNRECWGIAKYLLVPTGVVLGAGEAGVWRDEVP